MFDYFRVACAVPDVEVADVKLNTQRTVDYIRSAADKNVDLLVFPELGLTGYTCGDLFFQQPLQRAAARGLTAVLEASADLDLVALVGLPVTVDGKLYNCAAVVCHGKLLGLVPKTYLPNYGEFYERRQFNPAPAGVRTLHFSGQEVPFGTQLLFRCAEMPEFCPSTSRFSAGWPILRPKLYGLTLTALTVNIWKRESLPIWQNASSPANLFLFPEPPVAAAPPSEASLPAPAKTTGTAGPAQPKAGSFKTKSPPERAFANHGLFRPDKTYNSDIWSLLPESSHNNKDSFWSPALLTPLRLSHEYPFFPEAY